MFPTAPNLCEGELQFYTERSILCLSVLGSYLHVRKRFPESWSWIPTIPHCEVKLFQLQKKCVNSNSITDFTSTNSNIRAGVCACMYTCVPQRAVCKAAWTPPIPEKYLPAKLVPVTVCVTLLSKTLTNVCMNLLFCPLPVVQLSNILFWDCSLLFATPQPQFCIKRWCLFTELDL